MLSFKFFSVVLVLNLLAGCGFEPLYGHKGAVNASNELASIRIKPIKDRIGQELHNHLLDLLNPHGRPGRPQYILEVNLKPQSRDIAISKEALATRVSYLLTAKFRLIEAKTGKLILSGLDRVTVGYNVLTSNFATKSAEIDAQSRAVRQASFNIQTQIASYFKTSPAKLSGANTSGPQQ